MTTKDDVVSLSTPKVINQRAFANSLGIPMGAIVHLLPTENGSGICQITHQPHCCRKCGAYLNPYCTLDVHDGKWMCNFCQQGNSVNAGSGRVELQASPEMTHAAVDYISTVQRESTETQRLQVQVVVFVVDLTFGPQVLHLITESAIEQMDSNIFVGLVLVDSCVSLVNLEGEQDLLDLHCIPGHTVNMPASLRQPAKGFGSCIRPLQNCRNQYISALDAITASQSHQSQSQRRRCLGTAVHEALNVVKETRDADLQHLRRERIVVLTSGPANYGPGGLAVSTTSGSARQDEAVVESHAFFDRLAEVSASLRVRIDLYGVSFSPLNLSAMESLPKATSGILAQHSVITPDLFATQITQSFHRSFGTRGLFDIRLSRGLRLSAIVGKVSDKVSSGESGSRRLTNNACVLKSMEKGRSLSLFMEATADFSSQDLYIQLLLMWREPENEIDVERVITCALSPTGNLQDFLKSIKATTVGVLMAKKISLNCTDAVFKNDTRTLENAGNGLAYKLAFLVEKFGKLLECKDTGFFGFRQEKKWACPLELWNVAQCLYHFHRGPLLGRAETHPEEVSFLHRIFLSANLECADRMIVPKLFIVDAASLTLIEVAAITICLRPRCVMLIDHGLYIYIWIGSKAMDESRPNAVEAVRPLIDLCVEYARNACVKRAIMPELITVREGVDDRSIYQHLTPSHRDSEADQAAQTSKTATPSTSDLDRVEYPQTQMLSFYEWCRVVNAEPPKLNRDAMAKVLE